MKIQIDDSLTVENAKDRSLEWVCDEMYDLDPEAPIEANKEVEEFAKQGMIFGTPMARKLLEYGGVGVYQPIKS